MTLTLRKLHSEQSALEAALRAYADLYSRLVTESDERGRKLADRSYARGLAVLESLAEMATEEELDDAEQSLLDMFLTSARSDDREQQRMWLGLLPESMERMFSQVAEEPLRAVAEEPALYEARLKSRTFERWEGSHGSSTRRWEQPTAV